MRWIDYRKKLGIGFNDKDKAEMLSNKIATFICNDKLTLQYTRDDYYRFCLETGIKFENRYEPLFYITRLFSPLLTISELVSYYVAFANTAKCSDKAKKYLFSFLDTELDNLAVPFETIEDKDGIFIFPKGAKELDDALVSEPLEWLGDYPNARKAWISALKDYSEATPEDASDVADKFRKALETFFQEYFKNTKSLENLKSEYGTKLKEYGVPSEISSNFVSLLDAYTKYNNNYAKHQDKTSSNVLEYIMYQTGNIIRLLIMLKKEDEAAE